MVPIWRRAAGLPRWLTYLLVGQFISSVGTFASIFMTLFLVEDRDLSPSRAGLIAGTYGIAIMAGNLTGGFLGDRFGAKRVLLVALGITGVCWLALPATPTPLLAVLVAVTGYAGGNSRPLMTAIVAGELPAERRREGVALFRAVVNAGMAIGPPVGGLLVGPAFPVLFVIDGASSLLLALVIWRSVPSRPVASRAERASYGTLRSGLAATPMIVRLIVSIALLDIAYRMIFTILPLYVREAGHPAVFYGALVTVNCLTIVIFEAPLAISLRDKHAVVVISGGAVLVAVGLGAIALGTAIVLLVAAMLVITVGEMFYKPTAAAYAADLAPPGMLGRFQSLYAASSLTGMVVSAPLGGAIFESSHRMVWVSAAVLALISAILLGTARRDDRVVPSEQEAAEATG